MKNCEFDFLNVCKQTVIQKLYSCRFMIEDAKISVFLTNILQALIQFGVNYRFVIIFENEPNFHYKTGSFKKHIMTFYL